MKVPRLLPALLAASSLLGCARVARTTTIVAHAVAGQLGPGRVDIELDRSFVQAYRDRTTIETTFTVDAVHRSINPPAFDGDLHFAGRAPEIGLRLVAEIKNAKSVDHAVALIRGAESTGIPLELVGGWRFWPEHAIGVPHRQGQLMGPLPNANPDHIFEVHPVIRVGTTSLLETLRPVEGYRPYSAPMSFGHYERAEVLLKVRPTTVVLRTPAGLYNDVHFLMEVTGTEPVVAPDGRILTARALDLNGNVLVEDVRMVFIKDSPPEIEVQRLGPGVRRHVWGLPRVSFAGLLRLIEAAGSDSTPMLAKLPYELVIVGVYPEGR
ncbi:MAG TPA: hypothetical protein VJK71_07500 [Gemmatimonadales bacterium]|nr:hypothetical protein [Gemmatimonadales bacterium]